MEFKTMLDKIVEYMNQWISSHDSEMLKIQIWEKSRPYSAFYSLQAFQNNLTKIWMILMSRMLQELYFSQWYASIETQIG